MTNDIKSRLQARTIINTKQILSTVIEDHSKVCHSVCKLL